ncbi:10532_t:CDS:1, partial [Ambispora leptoticha]
YELFRGSCTVITAAEPKNNFEGPCTAKAAVEPLFLENKPRPDSVVIALCIAVEPLTIGGSGWNE